MNASPGWTVNVPEEAGGVNGSCAPGSTSGTGGDEADECVGYATVSPFAGGGGGGGYYGGGGGEAWYSYPYGDGGFGGGGGSSFGPPGTSFTPGVASGNGYVVVTFTPGAPPPYIPSIPYGRPIAIAGVGSATVSFAAPRLGLPIRSYRVTAYPISSGEKGGDDVLQATGSRTPITIKGLTDGTTYTFRVSATNVRGTGPLSLPSDAVTPAPTPATPTNARALAGGRFAVVAFKSQDSPLSAPITSYTVVAFPGGAHSTARRSPIIVPGLTSGTTYIFKVYATNRIGSSLPGTSNPVTVAGPALGRVERGRPRLHHNGTYHDYAYPGHGARLVRARPTCCFVRRDGGGR